MTNDEFSKELKRRIYVWNIRLVKHLRTLFERKDRSLYSILDQLIRSGTSVGANYVEATGGSTSKQFRRFLSHALKSANETKFWLALIKDTSIDSSKEVQWLLNESIEISKILGRSVSTLYKNIH